MCVCVYIYGFFSISTVVYLRSLFMDAFLSNEYRFSIRVTVEIARNGVGNVHLHPPNEGKNTKTVFSLYTEQTAGEISQQQRNKYCDQKSI